MVVEVKPVEQKKVVTAKANVPFSTGTGKNDMDFEEVKGRAPAKPKVEVFKKKRYGYDSSSSECASSSDEEEFVQQNKKGDAAKKKKEEKEMQMKLEEDKKNKQL